MSPTKLLLHAYLVPTLIDIAGIIAPPSDNICPLAWKDNSLRVVF